MNLEKEPIIEEGRYADRLSQWAIEQLQDNKVQTDRQERNWLHARLYRIGEDAQKLGSPIRDTEGTFSLQTVQEGIQRTAELAAKIEEKLINKFSDTRILEEERTLLSQGKKSLTEFYREVSDYLDKNINEISPVEAGRIYRTLQIDKRVFAGLLEDMKRGIIQNVAGFREELANLRDLKNLIAPVGDVGSLASKPPAEIGDPQTAKVQDIESFFVGLGGGIKEAAIEKRKEYERRIQAVLEGKELKEGDARDLERLKRDYLKYFGGIPFWEKEERH